MKSKLHNSLIVLALLALFTLNSEVSTARAQGTAFTYSGQIKVNGSPASGFYDMAFTLFITDAGGIPFAGPVVVDAVVVANGLFTVVIDFGPIESPPRPPGWRSTRPPMAPPTSPP
jgi:hypothetical protein